MPIEYRDISALGINPVPFSILTPDHHTARIMMLQCGGEIATDNAISHTNGNLAKDKFRCFFRIAREGLASLALTSEYSCPWDVIKEVASEPQKHPTPGSLWIVGGESIRLDELNKIKQDTAPFVDWRYEIPTPNGNQSFVSPVVYLFRLVKADNTPELCAIVQFKAHDMGGTNFERDRLIKGNVRYVLRNQNDPASIRLVTIICADALIFEPANELLPHQPYLIVHPQLNLSPYHAAVNEHRSKIFRSGLAGTCEILTLNWAKGFSIGGKTSKDYGGSAYYMSPEREKEPDQDEARIEANHKKGIYLKFSETFRYSAFLFTPVEAVFVFDTPKVSQFNSPPENRSRSGPCAAATHVWIDNDWQEAPAIDDGVKGDFEYCGGLNNMSACEREKLLAISNGAIEPKKRFLPPGLPKEIGEKLYPHYWHKPRNLNSYHLDANESPQGTVVRLQEFQGDEIAKKISCFTTLKAVLSTPENLPEVLSDLKTAQPLITLDLSENGGKFIRHNVCQQAGKGWVAASFLGDTMPVRANIVFSNIKKTLSPKRAVLWFRHAGTLRCLADEVQQISDAKESLESISRGEEE